MSPVGDGEQRVFIRPVPLIGDVTSAAQRRDRPDGWAFGAESRRSVYDVIGARRDVRRYRPDAIPTDVLRRVLAAAHAAPSVGHSQPWRFVIVTDPDLRQRAAWMADQERLAQAALLDDNAGRHLLDLQLEGIREAPVGVVVCCDRRAAAAGVLGRATLPDADLWSCACAIENLWLAARAEGLGVGWVTLFRPDELTALIDAPDGVETLGWLCIGWPDERPPTPGLERAGWSSRLELDDVIMDDRWPCVDRPAPTSRLRSPQPSAVVAARDDTDLLLTAPGSLGMLDRATDRIAALGGWGLTGGCLVLVVGDHPVAELGVTAYRRGVGCEVLAAARAGQAHGIAAARSAGLEWIIVDAGAATGDLLHADAMSVAKVQALIGEGRRTGATAAVSGLVVLGEVGIGNTTVAAALTAALLDDGPNNTVRPARPTFPSDPARLVGLGSGSDSAMLARKREVVGRAVVRARAAHGTLLSDPIVALASLGGPEFAYLTGVVLGAVEARAPVVLDGLATSVAALAAAIIEPAVTASLIAGQRSREHAHPLVLARLGLEPLLDLRLRAGEGIGASFAAGLLLAALRIRRETARVEDTHPDTQAATTR